MQPHWKYEWSERSVLEAGCRVCARVCAGGVDVQGLWHQVYCPYIEEWAPAGPRCYYLGSRTNEGATRLSGKNLGLFEHLS